MSGKSTTRKTWTCHITRRSWSSSTCKRGFPKQFSTDVQNATRSSCPERAVCELRLVTWRMFIQPACHAVLGNNPYTYAGNLIFLSPEQRMHLVRKHQLCYNCLQSGNFTQQCASDRKCHGCRKPHHTLLHVHVQFEHNCIGKTTSRGTKQSVPAKTKDSSVSHSSHLSSPNFGGQRSTLMMMCQIAVMMSDSHVMGQELCSISHCVRCSSLNIWHGDCSCLISTSVFESLALVFLNICCLHVQW